ncbi:MAG: TetR/AcrR family transcriptional regulator [Acidimicrobiia bacterium]
MNSRDTVQQRRSNTGAGRADVEPGETSKRPYRMTARAEATRATGDAILDAALAAFERLPFEQVTLRDVADQSGVTVQTVIRRYGSKEQLFEAVAKRERVRVTTSRAVPDDADLETALGALLDHYEQDGDVVLHLVAQEHHSALVREVVQDGRRIHRVWVERHCGAALAETHGQERERRIHAAIAATDLGTWQLLRRDLGLERGEVEAIMITLLNGMEKS